MEPKQTKIGIETIDAESDKVDVEFPWADHLGGDHYQLKNFPFYAYGVSFDDIVEARLKYDDDPYPYLTKVLEKSGRQSVISADMFAGQIATHVLPKGYFCSTK